MITMHLHCHSGDYSHYTGIQQCRTHSGFGEILDGGCGETQAGANSLPSVTDVPIARTTIPDSPSRSKN